MFTLKKSQKGFTLIELMIVVAIIGVLAAIAYPSYQQSVIRGKRVDAQSEMLQIAQNMANYKLRSGTFSGATIGSIYGATADADNGVKIPKQGTALYKLYFVDSSNTVLVSASANEWTLIAKPIAGTQQADNGVICLNDQGQKFWAKAATACALSNTSDWSGR